MVNGYEVIKAEALELKPVSESAFLLFKNNFNSIESFIKEKNSLDKNFSRDVAGNGKQAFISDINKSFGKLLLSVYELGLQSCLADEGIWYYSTLSARGFDDNFFFKFLFNWNMAIQSVITPPESHELVSVTDYFQRNIAHFRDASLSVLEEGDEKTRKFLSFLLDKNRKGAADYAIELLGAGDTAQFIFSRVLAGAMRNSGMLWQRNKIEVSDVHVATDICHYVMYRIVDSFDERKKLPYSIAVFCVPGEEHEIGAELVENALELEGWNIVDVGHISPEDDMIHSLKKQTPDVILLSVTMTANLPSAVKITSRIRKELPGVKIIAGGSPYFSQSDIFGGLFDGIAPDIEDAHNAALNAAGER